MIRPRTPRKVPGFIYVIERAALLSSSCFSKMQHLGPKSVSGEGRHECKRDFAEFSVLGRHSRTQRGVRYQELIFGVRRC